MIWQKIMVERHAFAPISTKRWVDLRATCCSLALPRSLDKALTALGLPVKKDKEGKDKGGDTSEDGWWCIDHGIPEEQCSMCSAKVETAIAITIDSSVTDRS